MCVCVYVCIIKSGVLKICRVLTLTSKEVISASAHISNIGSY